MEVVKLKLAFSYVCPTCQTKQHADAVLHEFTPDEQREAEMEIGDTPRTGEWVSQPEIVTCPACHGTFYAENGADHIGDDDTSP